MEQTSNSIILRGELAQMPVFSHENHGKRFFRFLLSVPRLSGAIDLLPVIAEESVLNTLEPEGGSMITVIGQIRSHNYRAEGVRRLLIFVFAASVLAEDGEPINEVVLEGPLCKEPTYRRTPLGREICDLLLAVNRRYGRADYLPCIAWGAVAQQTAAMTTGDRLTVEGRIQSRTYTKVENGVSTERTAYEVSIMRPAQLEEFLF